MKRTLIVFLTAALVLGNSTIAFAVPETVQEGITIPLVEDNTYKNTNWMDIPEIVYPYEIRELIWCKVNGNPTAAYHYRSDNSLISWDSYEYNSAGNLTATYWHSDNGNISMQSAKEYEYDADGKLKAEYRRVHNSPKNKYVYAVFEYDTDGKLIVSAYDYFDGYEAMTYEYGTNGNLTGAYGPESGIAIIFEYDADGKVASVYYGEDRYCYVTYEYNTDGTLAAKYRHYGNGNIAWDSMVITYVNGIAEDVTTTYEYDVNGRLIAQYYYETDGSIKKWTTYEYNTNGNILKKCVFYASGYAEYTVYEYAD